jgi:hypothetical protein
MNANARQLAALAEQDAQTAEKVLAVLRRVTEDSGAQVRLRPEDLCRLARVSTWNLHRIAVAMEAAGLLASEWAPGGGAWRVYSAPVSAKRVPAEVSGNRARAVHFSGTG